MSSCHADLWQRVLAIGDVTSPVFQPCAFRTDRQQQAVVINDSYGWHPSVLAGFDLFTMFRNLRSAGDDATAAGLWAKMNSPAAGSAMQQWQQTTSLSGDSLGVGLPVGAAAYVSEGGIHAFGFLFLSRVAKQEL